MQSPTINILKIGGKLIADEKSLLTVLKKFHQLDGPKILVHGGGNYTSQLCKQLDIPIQMHEGRRITDQATLDVATMVYAGLVNKKIVSLLQALGCNALGLSGADGNVMKAHKRSVGTIDYGFAGDIDQIDGAKISQLIQLGFTPVFCALTHDQKGQLLNTNADTIAAMLAQAMTPYYQTQLWYCFEKQGVLAVPEDDESVLPQLNFTTFKDLQRSGIIFGGMIPKLDNAFQALAAKVAKVTVCGPYSFIQQKGTTLSL